MVGLGGRSVGGSLVSGSVGGWYLLDNMCGWLEWVNSG